MSEYLFEKKFAARDGSQTVPALGVQGLARLGVSDQIARPSGFNALPPRFELKWVAGSQGLPQLNAVTDPPAGDTYNTAAVLALLNADRHFEVLGTNAESDNVTYNAEGGINLLTDAGDDDQGILLPHLNSNQSPWTIYTWGTDKAPEWECHIATTADIVNTAIWAGLKLTNTSVVATDDDQAFFRFSDEEGANWTCVTSRAGVDTTDTTNIAVAASTEYHLKITIDTALIPRFYINGVLVSVGAALVTAKDFIPYIGVQATTTDITGIVVYGQAISRIAG